MPARTRLADDIPAILSMIALSPAISSWLYTSITLFRMEFLVRTLQSVECQRNPALRPSFRYWKEFNLLRLVDKTAVNIWFLPWFFRLATVSLRLWIKLSHWRRNRWLLGNHNCLEKDWRVDRMKKNRIICPFRLPTKLNKHTRMKQPRMCVFVSSREKLQETRDWK